MTDANAPSPGEPAALTDLAGDWSGKNHLWFMPGDPVRESAATATVAVAELAGLVTIAYTWDYEGDPQEGSLMIRTASEADDVRVSWIDSWHTGRKFMTFRDDPAHAGLVAVHGTYGAPTGPDWGWRIELNAATADEIHVRMHNITPDGEEVLAVETWYAREVVSGR